MSVTTSKQVILNVPDLLVVQNVSNTIEVHGETVAFRNVNLVLTNSTPVPVATASSMFTVYDNGSDVNVTAAAFPTQILDSLKGGWYIPSNASNANISAGTFGAGYTTTVPGAAQGGIMLTNDSVPSSFSTSISRWLGKLVYDNVTYRYLSPADIAGISFSSSYVQHMMSVAVGSGATNTQPGGGSDAVATSVYNALNTSLTGTNSGVRRSLYEQMLTQDPVRFTYGGTLATNGAGVSTDYSAYPIGFSSSTFNLASGFGTDSRQNMPFRTDDELRFLTQFKFSQSSITPSSSLSTDPTASIGGNKYATVSTSISNFLSNVVIIPDDRVIEFRLRISG